MFYNLDFYRRVIVKLKLFATANLHSIQISCSWVVVLERNVPEISGFGKYLVR